MDERNLDCCVVRDLLPSYLEDLTEAETAREVEAHLESCGDCRSLAENMRRDLPVEKAPKRALKFLKKVKRTRLLAAALSALLALLAMGWLYEQEFHYPNTEAGRLAAVCDYIPSEGYNANVVLGTEMRVVAWTEKTQNQKTAISMFSYLKHRNMAPSTRICRKDMNWMMRALQKRSDSHPTKGENRMKGRTMMAPSGYSRSPRVPYSHTPRGISRNWAPFSLKEFCAWISTSRQKAPQGTLSTGPGVWESCFMKSYAWFLRFSGFSTGFRTRQGGPAKGACPRSLTFPRVAGKPEEPWGPHPRGGISIRGL